MFTLNIYRTKTLNHQLTVDEKQSKTTTTAAGRME